MNMLNQSSGRWLKPVVATVNLPVHEKKDGTVFWVESMLIPLFDPISGAFKGMVGVTRDIQERKNKEIEIMEGTKQKENLLKEIHHRVKNNFAILVSLINMQMAQTKNQELLHSLINLQLRIRTMALVHEMLYAPVILKRYHFQGISARWLLSSPELTTAVISFWPLRQMRWWWILKHQFHLADCQWNFKQCLQSRFPWWAGRKNTAPV